MPWIEDPGNVNVEDFNDYLPKKSNFVVITSGGKIGEKASAMKIASIKIQSGFQPRYALGLSFFSLLKLMQELGFVKEENNGKKIIKLWQSKGEEYSSDKNLALQIAGQIVGFIQVIYSSEFLSSTGYDIRNEGRINF